MPRPIGQGLCAQRNENFFTTFTARTFNFQGITLTLMYSYNLNSPFVGDLIYGPEPFISMAREPVFVIC